MPPKKSAIRFDSQQRIVLAGSEKAPLPAAAGETPVRPSSVITISVIVKRKSPINTGRLGKDRITRAQYRQKHAADPGAIKMVHAFAKEFGLTIDKDSPKPERRTVKLTGPVVALQKPAG